MTLENRGHCLFKNRLSLFTTLIFKAMEWFHSIYSQIVKFRDPNNIDIDTKIPFIMFLAIDNGHSAQGPFHFCATRELVTWESKKDTCAKMCRCVCGVGSAIRKLFLKKNEKSYRNKTTLVAITTLGCMIVKCDGLNGSFEWNDTIQCLHIFVRRFANTSKNHLEKNFIIDDVIIRLHRFWTFFYNWILIVTNHCLLMHLVEVQNIFEKFHV